MASVQNEIERRTRQTALSSPASTPGCLGFTRRLFPPRALARCQTPIVIPNTPAVRGPVLQNVPALLASRHALTQLSGSPGRITNGDGKDETSARVGLFVGNKRFSRAHNLAGHIYRWIRGWVEDVISRLAMPEGVHEVQNAISFTSRISFLTGMVRHVIIILVLESCRV